MFAWLFHLPKVLTIIPGPTMKFNTALCFLLIGLDLILSLKNRFVYDQITKVLNLIILLICSLTFLQYLFNFSYNIDTFFVPDSYSKSHPGKMSIVSAICFILYSIASFRKRNKIEIGKKIREAILLAITTIALMAIFAFILQGPAIHPVAFFSTMPIYSAIFFTLLPLTLSLQNYSKGVSWFMLSRLPGSRMALKLMPFIIFFSLSIGYFVLHAVNSSLIELDFAVVIGAITCATISVIYISFIAIRFNQGAITQKELEASLAESNTRLQLFKDALDESSIVATTDAKGVITSVNDKFCEISKYERTELIGKTHSIINSGYHSTSFFSDMWKKISAGKVWIGGIKNKAKDGSYYWVHTVIIPFKNEVGKVYEYLAIRQDITTQKLLSTQYENLKNKSKEIEQFTYIASHDLQEPLRTVQSMIDLLEIQNEGKLDEESQQCLSYMGDAAERMSSLIKGLLDYSRIGTNRTFELVDCNELLKAITDDLASGIKESKAEIIIDPLPQIKAYKMELRLLFQNIISNAIKFRKKGVAPKVRISCENDEEYYKFSVSDNGIGISDQDNRTIFAIFQRLNIRSNFEGTGIGLAHCEKIAQLHGGDIWLKSKIGEGSTFYFTIPINLNS